MTKLTMTKCKHKCKTFAPPTLTGNIYKLLNSHITYSKV